MRILHPEFLVSPLDPASPELAGGRCQRCGAHLFPYRQVCPQCWEEDVRPISLGSQGELYAFSIARVAPPGFEAPYAFGYVRLPCGLRILSQLEDVVGNEDRLRWGQPLRLVIGPIRRDASGQWWHGFKFRPVWEE